MSDTCNPERPAEDARRLPCRGCLEDCANYAICDGKPWRILRDASTGAEEHAPGA